jgi:hypothetical protein
MAKFVTRTKWQYYVANVAGILSILGLLGWFIIRIVNTGGVDLTSIYFWLALLMLIILPFTLIGFFSSMKAVEVTAKGIIITYIFQKHSNIVPFAEMAEVRSQRKETGSTTNKNSFRDTFTLVLNDGRAFEFDRSQFPQYDKLKAICSKASGAR